MPRNKTDTQEKEENKASIEENFAQLEEIIKKLEAGGQYAGGIIHLL